MVSFEELQRKTAQETAYKERQEAETRETTRRDQQAKEAAARTQRDHEEFVKRERQRLESERWSTVERAYATWESRVKHFINVANERASDFRRDAASGAGHQMTFPVYIEKSIPHERSDGLLFRRRWTEVEQQRAYSFTFDVRELDVTEESGIFYNVSWRGLPFMVAHSGFINHDSYKIRGNTRLCMDFRGSYGREFFNAVHFVLTNRIKAALLEAGADVFFRPAKEFFLHGHALRTAQRCDFFCAYDQDSTEDTSTRLCFDNIQSHSYNTFLDKTYKCWEEFSPSLDIEYHDGGEQHQTGH